MTPEQLQAIRARLDAAPNATWNGSLVRFLCNDIRTLLDEVERLKAREESLVQQSVAQIGLIGRQQKEAERLKAEQLEADRMFDAMQPTMGTPVPPERRLRRQADVDAAFKRGAEAMRQAAVAIARKRADLPKHSDLDSAWCRSAECILDELRHLPVPEDK
jgi:hypothetical protein